MLNFLVTTAALAASRGCRRSYLIRRACMKQIYQFLIEACPHGVAFARPRDVADVHFNS